MKICNIADVKRKILPLIDPETRIYVEQALDDLPPVAGDLISRSKVRGEIVKEFISWTDEISESQQAFNEGLACACDKLDEAEVDIKVPTGYWKFIHPLQANDDGAYCCSVCGNGDWGIDPERDKYCYNCGAKMEGSKDENNG